LVACAQQKAHEPASAKELYLSPWFRFARAYAEKLGGPWRILSAKYGVIDPETVVAPYDLRLSELPAAARRDWQRHALISVFEVLDPPPPGSLAHGYNVTDKTVIFLAGEDYSRFLWTELTRLGAYAMSPLRGLGIGEQLRYLKQKAGL
jgi:hypothetical protein